MEEPVLAAGLSVWVVLGVALVVTLLTSLIKNVEWTHRAKNLLATGLSVVAAGVAVWVAGDFAAKPLFELTVYIYGLAQGFYNFILRGTSAEHNISTAVNSSHDHNAAH